MAWNNQSTARPAGKQKRKRPREVCDQTNLVGKISEVRKSGAMLPTIRAEKISLLRRKGNTAAGWARVKGKSSSCQRRRRISTCSGR